MNRKEVENLRLRKSDDLVKLAADLGYDSAPQQLQCNNGAHVSGLLNFFDDNPGAMEVLQEWILENYGLGEDVEDEEEESEEGYIHDSMEECAVAGDHLKSCDDDGYCNNCGFQ